MPLTGGWRRSARTGDPASRRPSSGATSTSPDRSKSSSHVAAWRGRPSIRSRAAGSRSSAAPVSSETTTSGAPCARVRRHWARSGNSACSGSRSTTPLSTMPPSEPASRPARCSDASPMVTEQPPSMARSATAPRGSTPCAGAPRPGERLDERALPAVGVHDVASRGAGEHVCRHRAHPRPQLARRDEPRRAVHRPVLGGEPRLERGDPGREEAERLDDVAHRLLELRLLVPGRPARRASLAGRSRSKRPDRCPPARRSVSSGVRQRRRTGVVRAVAIAQVRERGQEVPGVAPLGRQPRERPVQRLRRPGLVRVGAGRRLRVPALAGHVVGWGKSCGHGGRCYRRCPSWSGGGSSRRVTSEYLRKAEKGIQQRDTRAQADEPTRSRKLLRGGSLLRRVRCAERSAGRRRAVTGGGVDDVEPDAQRRAVRRRRGLAGGVRRRRDTGGRGR